jgi:hypothetical protein
MTDTRIRPPRQPLVAPGDLDHHFADMTATVSAELTLETLQARLAAHDQWLPMDGDPKRSIGELVEMNSTGPLRLGFGAWRDLLLGAQFTTSSGQLITAGGRTMKNVAGYDLTKFMVGQYGIFGRLVTITTRTYKRPTAVLRARFEVSDKLIGQLLPTPARPQWAMFCRGALWCGYLGDDKAIAFYEDELRSRNALELQKCSLQEDIDFRAANWLPRRAPTEFRASVPPTGILEFTKAAGLADFSADAGFGIVVGSCPADRKVAVRQAADAPGGRVSFVDAEDRQNYFGASSAERALLERIKSAFDQ